MGKRIMNQATAMTIQPPALTRAEALGRARVIAEVARENARRAEDLREMPQENVTAIVESELAMLLVPRRWGGFEMDWETTVDCIVEVGKACGSTAWCTAFAIDHNWTLSLFPEEAQRHVFERDPHPLIFTASAPEGKVVSVPGGYILNGQWAWASGSHHCSWGMIGAILTDDGPPKFLNMLIDPGSFEVLDDWHHFGLKGTGSSSVRLTDVFVPASHAVEWVELLEGRSPGRENNKGALYDLPLFTGYLLAVIAPMLGVARGALEDFSTYMSTKIGAYTSEKLAEQAPLQARIGEASAKIDAAELLVRNNTQRLAGETKPDIHERVRIKRNYLYAGQLLTEAVETMMRDAGARGGRLDNSMQRHFRDIQTMRQHVIFSVDVTYASAGRLLMGMDPDPRDRF
jgi:alkylation response protein AidB-like acyl-CoA dehydrogenase